MRDITELPHDLFLVVISYLSPRACVRCRRVSRQWLAAFTSDGTSRLLLRRNFPRCREIRLATAAAAAAVLTTLGPLSSIVSNNNLRAELACMIAQQESTPGKTWAPAFADVARRYYHLRQGRPRIIEKLNLPDKASPGGFSFRGVATWNRFLRLDEKTANFHYPDPIWSYSQEDGVLVYPSAEACCGHAPAPNDPHEQGQVQGPHPQSQYDGYVYQVLDLATKQQVPVPFDIRQKHIRRVRLAQGVLVFEWAEAHPYHQLNDREVVHRHFVTVFDVVRVPTPAATTTEGRRSDQLTWEVTFRCEFKLHFLGLPLNRFDRFFSAHTSTHWAVYFWQPNRSLYQDDPIEQLAVWDISSPSSYRPSEDPRGDKGPPPKRTPHWSAVGLWSGVNGTHNDGDGAAAADPGADPKTRARISPASAPIGPRVIRRMAWRELDFYGLRQRATPQLRSLALDDRNLYVVEEEHRWADGQHSWLTPPRVHFVWCTGIPIVPVPTSGYPGAAPGDDAQTPSAASAVVDGPVVGPVWVDACGANGDVNMSFCSRVASSANADDAASGSAFGSWPPPLAGALEVASPEELVKQLKRRPGAGGSSATAAWPWALVSDGPPGGFVAEPPARWLGLAPCWRHEDFPYLTVSEMVDFAAGVRVTARHCFMLETLSVHVRPAISVKGAAAEVDDDDEDGGSKISSRKATKKKKRSKIELLACGHIAGDERWIVGEDDSGHITIVRF
ncbi:hypothetical protein B0T26DRAFT_746007 [Lasiosphaeria miniovina]|uniref:F-box domain-containing protein n=1 Tax=Lasiosphaeria miniovina TaxID=1954250 RepID=A0AA40BGY9_9PEZI|nr:uncharacterized protein B0T26DRAFT_746007 [Lasiosphaeria miniovina]KAK0734050.1 hypothetical protein B0T26DRAFT_746007 [Lasiosphaeria miniovina]